MSPDHPFRFQAIDHVQLAMPPGDEAAAVAYFEGLLGFTQVPKPPSLAVRGGCWFVAGPVTVHIGAEEGFAAARKAHPAFLVAGIDALAARLSASGYDVRWDHEVPDVRRFHTDDPWGNRIEIVAAPDA